MTEFLPHECVPRAFFLSDTSYAQDYLYEINALRALVYLTYFNSKLFCLGLLVLNMCGGNIILSIINYSLFLSRLPRLGRGPTTGKSSGKAVALPKFAE